MGDGRGERYVSSDFYDDGDERATDLPNFACRIPSDMASRSRKTDSSSMIRLVTAPSHPPSQDLPLSQHLYKVAGICDQFPPRPNTKNACTRTPITLPAFIFMVPPTKSEILISLQISNNITQNPWKRVPQTT